MRRSRPRVFLRSEFGIVVALAVLASTAAWFRLSPTTQQTVWAEDGTIFLNDAISGAPAEHLFAGYAGYLQFLPRLIADGVVRTVDIANVGIAINLASCIAVSLGVALVYWCARDVIPSRPLRVVLCSITVLAPLVPIELLGNAANLHWFFMWAVLWALLYRPRTRVGAWMLAIVTLIGALSEIQLLVLLPLMLVRMKAPNVWPPRIGLAVGLVAQTVTTLLSPRVAHSGGLGGALRAYIGQVALPNFAANRQTMTAALGEQALLWEILAIAPFVLAALVCLRWGSPLQRVTATYLVPGSFVIWVADSFLNGYGGSPIHQTSFVFVRYAVVPSMFLLASIVLAAQVLIARRASTAPLGALVVAAMLVLMVVQYVPTETNRSTGPTWASEIAAARKSCESSTPDTNKLVVTAPRTKTALWTFPISCERLTQ
jgi:hypothetical protein